MNKVYALLVGINDYAPPVRKLGGCVNDVDHFHDWLKGNVAGRGLAVELLKDADATRENVIRQFRSHLGRAEAGDTVVFQYCGHGAQSASASAFKEFHPDGLDEGLVLYDSRQPGGHDLADKELAVLIGELAQREAHVAFILDSCHSGSGTRSADAYAGLQSRLTLGVPAERALETYLDGHYTRRLAKGESLRSAPGRHMLLAACDRAQEAKESQADRRGIFSTTLIEVLEASGGKLSYADLFVRCRSAVRKRAVEQDPQFEAIGRFDSWSGFLGGAAAARSLRHSVFFDGKAWKLDAGAIHGLGDEPDRAVGLALYDEKDTTRAAGTAHTIEVGAQESIVQFDGEAPPADARFRAAVTSLPTPPLLVHCAADATQLKSWQAALDGEGAPLASSGVLLTPEADGLRYALVVDGDSLNLTQREAGVVLRSVPLKDVKDLLYPLRTIAQWERLLGLRNQASQIDPATVEFVIAEPVEGGPEFVHEGETATLESVLKGGEWSEIKARLKVRNRSGRTLYPVLAYFSPDYGIQVLPTDPLPSGDAWVTLYGDGDGDAFRLVEGRETEETIDRFKLILSVTPVDGFLLEQPGLEERTRAIGSRKQKTNTQDWLTRDLRIRIVPRLDAVGDKAWVSADGAIVVKAHRRVRAQVNLTSARPATRGPGEGAAFIEALERAGLSVASFGNTRGAGDRSVIELSGIQGAESLAEEPLQIEIAQPLAEGEALLSFTFDGQHVLPCGDVSRDAEGRTTVTIDHIPETESDRRSLGGSLKLYFFKTYLKQNDVNRLRWIEYKADGSWAYREDGIGAQVAAAKRIVLMVHGIIGDTEGMAAGSRAFGLDRKFDLVLTYDYENLSTPIAETARTLKAQLADAGLVAGDDKHLTLLVHSMGGLVSRWFIEREGGKDVVDHLVMCGTPNSGSPFGKVDDARKLLGVLMGLAANYVPTLLPFTAPILLLLNRTQKVTPTLMQMDPASDFIRELNASDEPGIPYTILAGNVAQYHEPTDGVFAKLLAKTGQSFLFDALFAMKANDIAVAIDSITRVGTARKAQPVSSQVACHHLNYFVSAAGQEALKTVAW
jgi:pimeloyl-ACP methyl ester carboxylesterase